MTLNDELTDEAVVRFKEELKKILDNNILNRISNVYSHREQAGDEYQSYRKKNMSKFMKKEPSKRWGNDLEWSELTDQEKKEWKNIWESNIYKLGSMIKELAGEYEEQLSGVEDGKMKNAIIETINALQEDYDLSFGHVIEPSKYNFNESNRSIKQLVKESIQRIFEADYSDDEDDDAYRAAREKTFSELKKRKMIVLVGPPSVGKSTWIKSNFPNAYIINRDDIAEKVASSYGWTYDDMFAKPPVDAQVGDSDEKFGNVVAAPSWMTWAKTVFDKVQEADGKVQQLMNSRVSGAHTSGEDVVVDMTNMNAGSRKSAMKAIEGNEGDYHKVAVDFKFKGAEDVIKKMAEKRAEAAQRMGKSKTIPPDAFDRMFSSYEEPTKSEGFDEIRAEDNIEDLKRALNESIIKIVRESINKQ